MALLGGGLLAEERPPAELRKIGFGRFDHPFSESRDRLMDPSSAAGSTARLSAFAWAFFADSAALVLSRSRRSNS
jgi:hypothetical protein